jgi:hypothetical protein
MDDGAFIESEVERRLRLTEAILAAFPRARRMDYLRLLVEEHQRLDGRSLGERIQHLRVLMEAIDATAAGAGSLGCASRQIRPSS